MKTNNIEKLMIISLSFASKNYFSNHISILEDKYDVRIVNVDEDKALKRIYNRRSIASAPIEFVLFIRLLIKDRPKVVMTTGPKLGFFLAIICLFLRIKHIHWFTGQVWANAKFPKYKITYWVDYVIYRLSSVCFCDGLTQRKFLYKIFGKNKAIYTPKNGSINGLSEEFSPKLRTKSRKGCLKVCYIGRKAKGKGLEYIPEIARNFRNLDVSFLLAGPRDQSFRNYDKWKSSVVMDHTNIIFLDEYVLSKTILLDSDVLILPSEREGFGNIVVEAQSCGVVPVCSDIYGLKDAFVDGVTGISCCSISDYINAINKLMDERTFIEFSNEGTRFSERFSFENFKKDLKNLYIESGVI
ncbi:glycosyltransferase [Vibrio vulnificus]|nr:glycosyltransferase [Vibrio vulnificus]